MKAALHAGVDLMQLFPESGSGEGGADSAAGLTMLWDDVFDFSPEGQPVARPLPDLGTTHQYRIRAVDLIGRSSAGATE